MTPIKHFSKNILGKDYVVGDIHGCFKLLSSRLEDIGFNYDKDRLFSVGDLVDRGEDSDESYEWLSKPWFHAVRGNHEQMAIDYTIYRSEARIYERNGGGWFLKMPKEKQQMFADEFSKLPVAIEVETDEGLVGIIHAECPTTNWKDLGAALLSNPALVESKALWNRVKISNNDDSVVQGVQKVYVGHTPLQNRVTLGNVHYIDTGACFGGKMTIVDLITGENN